MKKCFVCHKEKKLVDFYAHPRTTDGHLGKCKECCKQYQRGRDTRAYDSYRYRNSIKRYLSAKYLGMKSRCSGNGHASYHGRELMDKDQWTRWCEESYPTFISLYANWRESGFQKRLAPSVDRVDNSKGYVVGNLQWLSQSANTSKFTN